MEWLSPLYHLFKEKFRRLSCSRGHTKCTVMCTRSRLSPVQLFATVWPVAHQTPLLMGFYKQELWSELLFPSPGDLPNSGIKPMSPALAGGFFTTEPPGKPILYIAVYICQSKFPSSSYVHVPLSEDIKLIRTSLVAQTVTRLSTMRETWV